MDSVKEKLKPATDELHQFMSGLVKRHKLTKFQELAVLSTYLGARSEIQVALESMKAWKLTEEEYENLNK